MRQSLAMLALFAGCSFSHGVSGPEDAPGAGSDTSMMIDAFVPPADMTTMVDAMPDTSTTPTDTDGDGVADTTDNCPTVANVDQRDHDMDAKGDVCDKCPHIAVSGLEPDSDNDGVGDACDPRMNTAGDSIALFEGFYDATSITGWNTNNGNWSVANGVLTQSSTTSDTQIVVPGNITRAAVTASAKVLQLGSGTGFSAPHVSVAAGVASNQSYWCSVVEEGQTDAVYATVIRPAMAPSYPNTNWQGTFNNNSVLQLRLWLIGSNNQCQVVQGGTQAQVSGNIGSAVGQVQLAMRNASASYDYLFVVAIGN